MTMKLKAVLGRVRRNVEAFAYALEFDEKTDIRLRVERLERLVANLNARISA
jgi:hypothetical protein